MTMVIRIKNLLCLKGTFSWALKEMKKGKYLTMKNVTGTLVYRLSNDGQYRLEWSFDRDMDKALFANANFFLSDANATNWVIHHWSNR